MSAALSPERVAAAVATVVERIPPVWPLDAMVATHPFPGLTDRDFVDAARERQRVLGRPTWMARDWYRRQYRRGAFTDADIRAASALEGGPAPEAVREALDREATLQPPQLLYAHLLDGRYRPGNSRSVVAQISGFCAAYHDQGQALWRMPSFGDDLYAAWRAFTRVDRTPSIMELPPVAPILDSLPERADELVVEAVRRLGVPEASLEDFLWLVLADVGGWAAYLRGLQWEADRHGEEGDDPACLLAIRLAWEVILVESCDRPARVAQWRQSLGCWPAALNPEAEADLAVDRVLQRAAELGWQRRVAAALAEPAAAGAESPAFQAVFCIDVRSEVFRRALEAVEPEARTVGFAGFFGLPVSFRRLGDSADRDHLPVLLAPHYRVLETAGEAAATEAATGRRKRRLGLTKAWKAFKLSAASCFSFVETVGLTYAPRLVTDGLGWTRPVPDPERAGLDRRDAAAVAPDPDAGLGEGAGIPVADRVELAADLLENTGLGTATAPVVLLVGHGSSTVNNPHRAGLDCGACGGQTGEASVRLAATLLNDPEVRAGLAERGQPLPEATRFVPALHDTTTDEVALLDTHHLPPERTAERHRIEAALARAGDRARLERLPGLEGEVPPTTTAARRAARSRARDWARIRPEWGLTGNAAFIAAPRARTAGLDLAGRAFLHDYDWRRDPEGRVLQLILNAPLMVAVWINLQYYGSTVDPDHLGAGNKVLHNVVGGRVGVLEGNVGDLRIGLARQSLHDGSEWVHEPLRLSAFIEAPEEALEVALAEAEEVRGLVERGWLHLFRIDDDGAVAYRRPAGDWIPGPVPAPGEM
ncbi:MAG: YbcC family protein [Pseudomonadota bacterium]